MTSLRFASVCRFKVRGPGALSLCPSPTSAIMSAAFGFVKEALFDLRSGLELARLNSADAEAWLAKFSRTLVCGSFGVLRALVNAY
jgi:hypothetical protein